MHYILPEYPKKNFNETEAWEHYVQVNRAFADALVATYLPGDISKHSILCICIKIVLPSQ